MARKTAVVIVEDRVEDRFFLKLTLEDVFPECDVFEFSHGDDALTFLRSPGRPKLDFLFVDIAMPRMDGFQFAQAYSDLYVELKGRAKLFITSSSIDPTDRKRAKDMPSISGFLEKPVGADMLRALTSDATQ